MSFGNKICRYQREIFQALEAVVKIPSVRGAAEANAPFGKESARALDTVLQLAAEMGLKTENVGGYAGHAEYGEGEEIAAVLTHVDVVPAGNGWKSEPFALTCRDGLCYGRGTADDKGAAIVALYCLKALKDEGVQPHRRLRVIFGAGEETGMEDMEEYFRKEPLPEMAFTPDSEYGICNREKGILHFSLSSDQKSLGKVKAFRAGLAVNAVPDTAEAELECGEEEIGVLREKTENGTGFTLTEIPGGVRITSKGRAAHASHPEIGFNAATHLIGLLVSCLSGQTVGQFFLSLSKLVGNETDGKSLGIQQSDVPSGPLTLNLGVISTENGKPSAFLDIRYPVTSQGEEIISQIRRKAEKSGLTVEVQGHNPPLYLPEDGKLISLLKDSYRQVMGKEAELYSTGGGTYARAVLGKGVAFGPVFPGEPDRCIHNANEHIDPEKFMLHAQICLEAMYHMITL